uniref:Putative nucleoside-diphosphate sugar epimerase n=1 Tax=Tabanus bromius TaxID=304241 RepID=A0A0K8TKJ3_TABBR
MTWHDLDQKGLPDGVTAVVNLTGQNVLDPTRRWTPGFKQNVWNSRINSASALAKAIEKSSGVQAFVNVSGVSLYQPSDKIYTEDDSGETYDFMSKLCIEWEKASNLPKDSSCRQVNVRSGVVIGRGGGMIASIQLPFWLGLGGPIGSGNQPLPWIHILDLCRLIQFAMENPNVSGPLNGVAPEIVTNEQFSKAYASALRRPAIFAVPEFVVDLLFGKERSVLLTTGAKVKPKKVLDLGFEYKYPTAKAACTAVVNKSDE